MDSGSIAFVIICAALVFFMTPGLSYFYGGLVRRKNAVNTMFASVVTIAIGIVMWMLFGYSLAFGPDHGGVIGDFSWFGLSGVSKDAPYVEGQQIPNMVFCLFQMMFAVITPALITGAIAGRMRFKSLVFFLIFWSIIVYYPMAHMVWADGGFLAKIGSVDFAGGNVVHISSGVSALVLCILLGNAMIWRVQIIRSTIFRLWQWARLSCCSVGSALTLVLHSQQMVWLHTHL